MSRTIHVPSVELLRERYALDLWSGKFVQRHSGKTLHGYANKANRRPFKRVKIVWDGHSYGPSYSRAIYAWIHGYWPEKHVIHSNGNTFDNRPWNLCELKLAKQPEQPTATQPVDDGIWCAGPRDWQASVKVGSNVCWIGSFISQRQAALNYRAALRLVAS